MRLLNRKLIGIAAIITVAKAFTVVSGQEKPLDLLALKLKKNGCRV